MLQAPYILLAEDSDDDTYFARRCFAASGSNLELKRCTDGSEVIGALEQCGANLPTAVILDLKMPKVDGFETLEWIRRNKKFEQVPVVVLSSSPLQQDVDRAKQLGANEYMVKPNSLTELERMLSELAVRLSVKVAASGTAGADLPRPTV